MTKKTAVIDLDMVKYSAASVGEKRSIIVRHKKSGREMECKTRTEFHGRDKKKSGGVLAEINKSKGTSFVADDFEYEDKITLEPIANTLYTAKVMVEKALKESGADKYIAYIGKGDSFRVELSTILEYKGNRKDLRKPEYLDEVTEYLRKKFKAEIITGIEADDACVMAAYKHKERYVLCIDKDFWGCPVNVYNVNHPKRGIVDCDRFGGLWIDRKNKVQGIGRMFLYFQILSQDTSDNYAANSASDIKWGDKSAYNALKDCRNDREAVQALVNSYQYLYPTPKEIIGWRGDTIEIDWKYVLNENFQMARMLRFDGDNVHIDDVLNNLGIKGV